MSTITSIPQVRQITPAAQQKMAFKANDNQPKFNSGAATASSLIPGLGQFAKGEVLNGTMRLGIEAGLIGGSIFLAKSIGRDFAENTLKGSKVAICSSIPVLLMANHISAAFDAFKPKKTKN